MYRDLSVVVSSYMSITLIWAQACFLGRILLVSGSYHGHTKGIICPQWMQLFFCYLCFFLIFFLRLFGIYFSFFKYLTKTRDKLIECEKNEKLYMWMCIVKCQVEHQGQMSWWDTWDNLVMGMRNVIIVITDNLLYCRISDNTGKITTWSCERG